MKYFKRGVNRAVILSLDTKSLITLFFSSEVITENKRTSQLLNEYFDEYKLDYFKIQSMCVHV